MQWHVSNFQRAAHVSFTRTAIMLGYTFVSSGSDYFATGSDNNNILVFFVVLAPRSISPVFIVFFYLLDTSVWSEGPLVDLALQQCVVRLGYLSIHLIQNVP